MQDSLSLIATRNKFYQNNYRQAVILNLLLSILLLSILGFLLYQEMTRPAPKYFPTTPDGILIQNPPLNINHLNPKRFPVLKDGTLAGTPGIRGFDIKDKSENGIVIYWAQEAVKDMWDFDYINYARVIQDARKYFTYSGHQQFMIALNSSNNMETVHKEKLIVQASIVGISELEKTGIASKGGYAGRRYWIIKIPVNLDFDDGFGTRFVVPTMVTLRMIRVSTLQSLFYGLAIISVNFSPIDAS